MVILNSPGNPTGGVFSPEALAHVAEAARRRNLWILSDEIYLQLVYEGQAPSIVSLPGMAERTILADGFSKTYAMTGWRLGFGIVPEPLAVKLGLLITHSTGCTATFTQFAGVQAILGSQSEAAAMRAEFHRRRNVMVEGLSRIPGIRCTLPRGAFYAFPNVQGTGIPSAELATLLLQEAGVAVLPGTSFGQNGEGYLRLSYANSMENIEIALERIERTLTEL
jgi:aspartate/methionine/tyrosine aminotransferase